MGKKRTEREAEVELAQNAGSINNNDLELKLVNGDRDEKRREKKKKKKKEERSERVVEAQDAEKSRPEIESEVVNSDSKDKKKKKEKLKERNGAVSNELPTVSIALPGSIIDNAQSLELATRLAGQIARAATIFRIDEVVVFDNMGNSQDSSGLLSEDNLDENGSGAAFLLMILRVHYPHLMPHIICGSMNGLHIEKVASKDKIITIRPTHRHVNLPSS